MSAPEIDSHSPSADRRTSAAKIVFVNRYFYPDHSATSQILTDLAFHLASKGERVSIVTSRQTYENPKAHLADREIIDRVEVHRVDTSGFGRARLFGRASDYATFYLRAWGKILEIANPGDVLVAKTDPPLLSILGSLAARRRKLSLINWLQDIYPEIATELGVKFLRGPLLTLLTGARNRSLVGAQGNVVLGERMANRVSALGVPRSKIHIIPNWVDDAAIAPLPLQESSVRRELGLGGKFVVGYSGNLGRAHDISTIIAAAEELRSDETIVFLMIGGGTLFQAAIESVSARNLTDNFRFLPYQPQNRLRETLAAANLHWVSLQPRLEGLLLPSKFYGIAAAGRPIVVIGDPAGEIGSLVEHYGCGLTIRVGEGRALAEAIRRLSREPDLCNSMGRRARSMFESQFSRQNALHAWDDVLQRVRKSA